QGHGVDRVIAQRVERWAGPGDGELRRGATQLLRIQVDEGDLADQRVGLEERDEMARERTRPNDANGNPHTQNLSRSNASHRAKPRCETLLRVPSRAGTRVSILSSNRSRKAESDPARLWPPARFFDERSSSHTGSSPGPWGM